MAFGRNDGLSRLKAPTMWAGTSARLVRILEEPLGEAATRRAPPKTEAPSKTMAAVMTVGLISFQTPGGAPRSAGKLPETLYFGNPAGSDEPRGFASPPHDGFAFIGCWFVLVVGRSGTNLRLPGCGLAA